MRVLSGKKIKQKHAALCSYIKLQLTLDSQLCAYAFMSKTRHYPVKVAISTQHFRKL